MLFISGSHFEHKGLYSNFFSELEIKGQEWHDWLVMSVLSTETENSNTDYVVQWFIGSLIYSTNLLSMCSACERVDGHSLADCWNTTQSSAKKAFWKLCCVILTSHQRRLKATLFLSYLQHNFKKIHTPLWVWDPFSYSKNFSPPRL